MPITPLHMGPGLAVKALLGRNFSLLTFGVAQVAMDVEPLVGMLRDSEVLHGPTHTYLGALCIAAIVAFLSPLLCMPILHRWNRELSAHGLSRFSSPGQVGRVAVVLGALIGTFSHVMFDSVMHADMRPLAPWSSANGLLHLISLSALELGCVGAGVLGCVVGGSAKVIRKREHED